MFNPREIERVVEKAREALRKIGELAARVNDVERDSLVRDTELLERLVVLEDRVAMLESKERAR